MLARNTPQFKITFECAASIRTLSDVLADTLDACDIAVHKTDAFTGIRVEAMDSKANFVGVGGFARTSNWRKV